MNRKRKYNKSDKAKDKIDLLKKSVLKLMADNPSRFYEPKQIVRKLSIKQKHLKNNIDTVLLSLLREDAIQLKGEGKFCIANDKNEIIGKLDYVNSRFAFIISDGMEQDIMVRAEDLKNALDDDLVRVKIYSVKKDGRPMGSVVEILERHRLEFVGRIEVHEKYAFVIPDFKKMHQDIFIRPEGIKKAKHNDKVIVRIKDWREGDKNPLGEVIKILGPAGNNDAEIHSIMAEFGLPFEFEDELITEAEKIP